MTGATGPGGGPPGPPGPTGSFPAFAPPDLGVLFRQGGGAGTSTNAAIANGGDLAFGTGFATAGDVRIPQGSDGPLIWSVQKRDRLGLNDLGFATFFSGPLYGDEFAIGANPFAPNFENASFGAANFFARLYFQFLLTDPAFIVAGDAQGHVIQAIDLTNIVVSYVTQHTNFAIAGRRQYPLAADFGDARATFFWGYANNVPTTAAPQQGVLAWCDPFDANLYYLQPGSAIKVPMRAQPAVQMWGNGSLGSIGTFALTPGFSSAAALGSVIEIPSPVAGDVTTLSILHGTPGGNANPITYTLHVNGAPTAVTVALPANGSNANVSGVSANIAQGSRLSLIANIAASVGTGPLNVVATIGITPIPPP